MHRAFLLLLAALVFTAGAATLTAKPPPVKPPPVKPPPVKPPPVKPPPVKPPPFIKPDNKKIPPKPGDDGRVLSRKLLRRVIQGNTIVETYEVTRRVYRLENNQWVPSEVKSIEKITKPLPGGGVGGVLPPVEILGGPQPDTAIEEAQATPYLASHLRIENQTGEKIKVFVQFRALNERDEWVWVPADPKEATDSVRYTYDAGESAVLEDAAGKVRASRVRIWAESDSGRAWNKHKEEDYWLVPEDSDGKRRYFASNMLTRVFTFKK